jgi:hypothetical protein
VVDRDFKVGVGVGLGACSLNPLTRGPCTQGSRAVSFPIREVEKTTSMLRRLGKQKIQGTGGKQTKKFGADNILSI